MAVVALGLASHLRQIPSGRHACGGEPEPAQARRIGCAGHRQGPGFVGRRSRRALAVNRELVGLYWQIGSDMLERQKREGWGAKVIDRLAHDLRVAFPDMHGFSPRNFKYMRAFAEAWPDAQFVQAVLAQLPWYHQLGLLDKLKTDDAGRWYAAKAIHVCLGSDHSPSMHAFTAKSAIAKWRLLRLRAGLAPGTRQSYGKNRTG
jgi:predicted nuclease of restriction endonuclease-like (RecB) superfamily